MAMACFVTNSFLGIMGSSLAAAVICRHGRYHIKWDILCYRFYFQYNLSWIILYL